MDWCPNGVYKFAKFEKIRLEGMREDLEGWEMYWMAWGFVFGSLEDLQCCQMCECLG